jgi:putative phosphoesterase
MRVAVFSDVHGNADALAAVLADIRNHAPDITINLGDCLSGPLEAERTAEMLIAAGVTATVRGNHDRYLCNPALMDDWDRCALPQLSKVTLQWLAELPAQVALDEVFACHATPQDDESYWIEAHTADGIARRAALDKITVQAEGIAQSLMLCGHTHVARAVRLVDGRLIVNPGSVGCPGYSDSGVAGRHVSAGTPFAQYAVLDRVQGDWAVMQRIVPYDTTRAVAMARAAGHADWVSALSTGWI